MDGKDFGSSRKCRAKIALVGSGSIGGTMALLTGLRDLGDVVLFDVVNGMPAGKALDLSDGGPLLGSTVEFSGTSSYSSISGADVVIVTAGLTKVPGKTDGEWSRDDLLPFNAEVMRKVGEGIKLNCPEAFVICITNPLDCMVKVLQEASGVRASMICGMAGVLDSARFRRLVAQKLGVCPSDVQGLVIGAHGDHMVPLPRYCTVNGIPFEECVLKGWATREDVDEIVQRTKHGGKEIVQLLGQGSASYAPASAAVEMAEAYLRDQKRLLPCAVLLSGQYGVNGLYIGVPCVIGGAGIEKVVELALNEEERASFNASVNSVKAMEDKLKAMEHAKSVKMATEMVGQRDPQEHMCLGQGG